MHTQRYIVLEWQVPQFSYFVSESQNITSDWGCNYILLFSCFYVSDHSSFKHLYYLTQISNLGSCQVSNSTKY